MKALFLISIIALIIQIDSEVLLSKMLTEFNLKKSYTVDAVLEDIREEYPFSPAIIKDMAEEIKQGVSDE